MSAFTVDDDSDSEASSALDNARQMATFSIVRVGRYYYYEGYRYESLADAIAYAQVAQVAQVVRSRHAARPSPPSLAPRAADESPSASDRRLMTELAITFVNGRFVFEGFQYDRLVDAANYAHLLRDSRPAGS